MHFLRILIFILITSTCICCTQKSHINSTDWPATSNLSTQEKELEKVWNEFEKAVLSKDLTLFKNLSGDSIYSPDFFKIPIEKFIQEKFNIVFNTTANEFYFKDTNINGMFVKDNSGSVSIKNKACRGEECSETIFLFTDIGNGFKFNSINTIP